MCIQSLNSVETEEVTITALLPSSPLSFWAVKSELYLLGIRWWAHRQGHPAAHGLDRCAPGQWRPGDLTGAASNIQGSIPFTHSTH